MKLIECPRDAMQGLKEFIPTNLKIEYINKLLKVGFDTIDFGSFVSPKAIPQMSDTIEVLNGLELSRSDTKLLAIVANVRGAKEASIFEEISYLGFPLSLSETFQQNNTNKSIAEAFDGISDIQDICQKSGKTLVTYISMGFGNPYGDPYETDFAAQFVANLEEKGVSIISLADTVGLSNPANIQSLFKTIAAQFPKIEFGVHLHSDLDSSIEKIDAAYKSGCRRFDGALNGFGGCPMAKDELVGNIATEKIIHYLAKFDNQLGIDFKALDDALNFAPQVFLGK
ncbi:hydroxymethylglutaryl-CoA lyase [Reichenbachiella sp. MALMAid0571]|uniref:hydroxymethylglutaryl-CoA lyase n=1 Tax=Reichenbachiella sp. MALMAid0571 TaxID=3143939 RepID=UPI0032DF8C3F